MTILLTILAVLTAYLIGAIPTAYLLVRAVKGIDIRTLGSGNVGATNAGRVLGAWGFLTVFLIDLLKGLLPTLLLPVAARAIAGEVEPGLPVLVAVATILGHNFPVYLRFRGGKGVATSLGAVAALDPVAAAGAAFAFAVFLTLTQVVSLSSILGALCFAVVHFANVEEPWSRDQIALSVAVILLVILMIVRHRTNLVRIAKGTEPKVRFRRRPRPPEGFVRNVLVIALALLAVGTLVASRASRRAELDCGRFALVVTDHAQTGHQRGERASFFDDGRGLAVTCPRYGRLVLYRIGEDHALSLAADVRLDGRPVAVWPTSDRLYVLQRPAGDARHLEPGFWRVYTFDGKPIGSRFPVGYDPDDLVVTADERTALVLLSGHAEGESNRPDPSLIAVDLTGPSGPRIASEHVFDRPGDDPERITLSERQTHAAVVLWGSKQVAGFDLKDPSKPSLTGRVPLAEKDLPSLSTSDNDTIWMPVDTDRVAVALAVPGERSRSLAARSHLVIASPDESCLEVVNRLTRRSLGRLPLRGPMNLGDVQPVGLAYSPERDRLAVVDRSGGVQVVAIRGSGGPARLADGGRSGYSGRD
jgi:acyl-phosphate glycerol 3-phosphate acyltransferase